MAHHAQLIIGTLQECREDPHLAPYVRETHPDIHVRHYTALSIDDVRTLRHEALMRPVARERQTFILEIHSANTSAQNALLKILEEPVDTTEFFILVPREELLIATGRSRLMSAGPPRAHAVEVGDTGAAFLRSGYAERLSMIAERTKEKDEVWIRTLLDDLEVWAAGGGNSTSTRALIHARMHVDRAGSSKKMLLEHLALAIPSPARESGQA